DPLVLADRDELHFRGDDAAAGVVHLGYVGTGQRATRHRTVAETHGVELRVVFALAAEFRRQPGQRLGVAALGDPLRAQRAQATSEVDRRGRVGIGAGAVIDRQWGVVLAAEQGRGRRQADLS